MSDTHFFCKLVFPSSPIPLAQLDILLLKLPGGGALFLITSMNFSQTLQSKETSHYNCKFKCKYMHVHVH